MEKGVFDMSLDIANRGTKQAMTTLQDVMGTSKDEDVRVYQALKPEDFRGMEQELGSEITMDYIRRMETKLHKSRR